jgi:protein-S-isoprenylcysteine O-methyltransferase Ste14
MTDRINPPETGGGPSLTALVTGIVGDLQKLVRQEIQLARTEVKHEWDKTKTAAAAMAAGASVLVLATILLCFMLVHLIAHYSDVPLWGCYGIVGGLLAILGLLLLFIGRARAAQVHVIPPQTAETMKESVQWLQNQT